MAPVGSGNEKQRDEKYQRQAELQEKEHVKERVQHKASGSLPVHYKQPARSAQFVMGSPILTNKKNAVKLITPGDFIKITRSGTFQNI
jgi:hypothetical protein